MKVHIDSLVKGFAGWTGKIVEGRVYSIMRSGAVSIIDAAGKQWVIYTPEVLDKPRPMNLRSDIPARLR